MITDLLMMNLPLKYMNKFNKGGGRLYLKARQIVSSELR
jgi:hypothetical protein